MGARCQAQLAAAVPVTVRAIQVGRGPGAHWQRIMINPSPSRSFRMCLPASAGIMIVPDSDVADRDVKRLS